MLLTQTTLIPRQIVPVYKCS